MWSDVIILAISCIAENCFLAETWLSHTCCSQRGAMVTANDDNDADGTVTLALEAAELCVMQLQSAPTTIKSQGKCGPV